MKSYTGYNHKNNKKIKEKVKKANVLTPIIAHRPYYE